MHCHQGKSAGAILVDISGNVLMPKTAQFVHSLLLSGAINSPTSGLVVKIQKNLSHPKLLRALLSFRSEQALQLILTLDLRPPMILLAWSSDHTSIYIGSEHSMQNRLSFKPINHNFASGFSVFVLSQSVHFARNYQTLKSFPWHWDVFQRITGHHLILLQTVPESSHHLH